MAGNQEVIEKGVEIAPKTESVTAEYVSSELEILKENALLDGEEIDKLLEKPSLTIKVFKKSVLALLNKVDENELNEEETQLYKKAKAFIENFSLVPKQWEKFKENCKADRERVDTAKKHVEENRENFGFTVVQQSLLGDSRIDLTKVLKTKNRKEFITVLAALIYRPLKKITDVRRRQAANQRRRSNEQQDKKLRVSAIPAGADGTSTMSDMKLMQAGLKGASTINSAKNLMDVFNKKASIQGDPLAFYLFDGVDENNRTNFLKLLDGTNPSPSAIKDKIEKRLDNIIPKDEDGFETFKANLEKTQTLTTVTQLQNAVDGDDETIKKLAQEKAQLVADLLDTMSSGWHKSKWGIKYEKYVLKKGELALTFDEWKATQNISFFENIYYGYIKTFMNMLFNIGEDPEEIEKKLQSTQFRKIVEDGDEEKEEPSGDTLGASSTIPASIDNSYFDDTEKGKALIKVFKSKSGKDASEIKIINNKQATLEEDEIEKISDLITREENSWELLTRGLELKDILFLAEHRSEENPDGINVAFKENGIDLNIDWGKLTGGMDEGATVFTAVLGAAVGAKIGAVTGAPLGGWGSIPGAIIGGVIGGVGTYFGTNPLIEEINRDGIDIGNFENGKLSYNQMTSEKLSKLINRANEMVSKAKTVEDLLNKYTKEELGKLDKLARSETFKTFVESLDSDLWDGYKEKLTIEDLLNFQKAEENGVFDSQSKFYNFSTFHAETEDFIDNFGSEVIGEDGKPYTVDVNNGDEYLEVDGTGEWSDWKFRDLKFKNAKSFFEWLKTHTEKK